MWRWGPGRLPVLRIDRRCVIAFAAATVPAVLWARLSAPPTPDVSWLLYAAGVLKDGGRLGADIVENSPPIIFALKMPVVGVARAIGVSAWTAWVWVVLLLSGVSGWLLGSLARGLRHGQWLGVLAFLLFILLPGRDFGQREHLTLILTAPWLIAAARRLEDRPATGIALWLAILFAAVGLGIKPHFLLVWVAVAWLSCLRAGTVRAALAPDLLALAVLGALQVVVVAEFQPWYLDHVRKFATAYMEFLKIPLWQALFIGTGPAAVLFALLARVAMRRQLDARAAGSAVLLGSSIAFWLAAGIQQKGWGYHYLPATGLALLAVAALLVESQEAAPGVAARTYQSAAVGVLAMALLAPMIHIALQWGQLEARDSRDLDPNLQSLVPIVRSLGPAASIFAFSTNIASGFPLASEGGASWAFRHPSLLMLGAAYAEELDGIRVVHPRRIEQRDAMERELSDELASDLNYHRPGLILVLRTDPRVPGWGGARQIDYLEYVTSDPALKAVFASYRFAGTSGDYARFVRQGQTISLPRPEWRIEQPREAGLSGGGHRVRWRIDWISAAILGLGTLMAFQRVRR